ncbi:MAG: c-type cytochrome [Solirubrobacterales bacterium]|nr:c-type cytochrome [Solirubrobacterales bacterium]
MPRRIRALSALLLGALALIGFAAAPSHGQSTASPSSSFPQQAQSTTAPAKLPAPAAPGEPTTTFPSSQALIAEGYNLYQAGCSSCHGISLRGQRGVAPSLIGVGAGPVDFYLSTGRMPLDNPRDQPQRAAPQYNRSQIDALIAYISSFGGPAAPSVNPQSGDLALGLHQFTLHCAGCHQVVARGGLTLGAQVPNLQEATPLQIAEAVRMGPYLMPRFTSKQIDQHELDSITRYVLWTRRPSDNGGWGIYNLGPIPEGMVAWFIALLALVIVARLIGERTA